MSGSLPRRSTNCALKPEPRPQAGVGQWGWALGLPAPWHAQIAPDKGPSAASPNFCWIVLFRQPFSRVFTSLASLLKDVKISNHHKVNISKPSLFKITHIFKKKKKKSLEFHLPSTTTPRLSFAECGIGVVFINFKTAQVTPMTSAVFYRPEVALLLGR